MESSGYLSPSAPSSPLRSARSSPALRSRPATHPLNIQTAIATSSSTSASGTSPYALQGQNGVTSSSSLSSRPASPAVYTSTIRPRRVIHHSANSSSSSLTPAGSLTFDPAGATRPQLERLVSVAETVSRADHKGKGKGKARESDVMPSQQQAQQRHSKAEKEVIIHQVQKTDTIASISLAYGISATALRAANRMWPSDSIHLRKTLMIPIEHCHLPSLASKALSPATSPVISSAATYTGENIFAPSAKRDVDLLALERQFDVDDGDPPDSDPWQAHSRWRSQSTASSSAGQGPESAASLMSSPVLSRRATPPASVSSTISSPDPFGLSNMPSVPVEGDTVDGVEPGRVEITRVPAQALSFFPTHDDDPRNGLPSSPTKKHFKGNDHSDDLGFSLLGPLANVSLKALTNARRWQWMNYGAEAEGHDVPYQQQGGVSLHDLRRKKGKG